MTIYFDMDGTIADLYAVENWLESLRAESPAPYEQASPMCNFSLLARYLNKIQKQGVKIGVISWGSKVSTNEYLAAVAQAKRKWLKQHLRSVQWDEIHIVPYGTPKEQYKQENDMLFDDELQNRLNWGSGASSAENLLTKIKFLSLMAGA